jgi:hypothetical protein
LKSTTEPEETPDDELWFLTTVATNEVSWLICFSTLESFAKALVSALRLFDEFGAGGPETALFLEEFDELGGPTIDPGPLWSGVYLPDLHCFFA